MNEPNVPSFLVLASPLLAGLAGLCSDTAVGPEQLRSGTFRLSVTGEAVADEQIHGTSRAGATIVDTLDDGRPVLRFSLDLEDADTDLTLASRFSATGLATGRLRISGAGDSLTSVDSVQAGRALVAVEPGDFLDLPVAVQSGNLTITTDTERELAGRIELAALPRLGTDSLGADSLGTAAMRLNGEFRARR